MGYDKNNIWKSSFADDLNTVASANYKSSQQFISTKDSFYAKYAQALSLYAHCVISEKSADVEIKSIEIILNWKPIGGFAFTKNGDESIEIPVLKTAFDIEPTSASALNYLGLMTVFRPELRHGWYVLARVTDKKGYPVNPYLTAGVSYLTPKQYLPEAPSLR